MGEFSEAFRCKRLPIRSGVRNKYRFTCGAQRSTSGIRRRVERQPESSPDLCLVSPNLAAPPAADEGRGRRRSVIRNDVAQRHDRRSVPHRLEVVRQAAPCHGQDIVTETGSVAEQGRRRSARDTPGCGQRSALACTRIDPTLPMMRVGSALLETAPFDLPSKSAAAEAQPFLGPFDSQQLEGLSWASGRSDSCETPGPEGNLFSGWRSCGHLGNVG